MLIAVSALVLSTQTYSATATGPLRVCKENPRYFADGSGRAIYLTGSHNWMASKHAFQAPFTGDAVLYIRSQP